MGVKYTTKVKFKMIPSYLVFLGFVQLARCCGGHNYEEDQRPLSGQDCVKDQRPIPGQDYIKDQRLFAGQEYVKDRWPFPCGSELTSHRNWGLLNTFDSCGVSDPLVAPRILGGKQAAQREFPWMTMLVIYGIAPNQFTCGGAIINNRYILTAAHCVDDRIPLFVRVGGFDRYDFSSCSGPNCHARNIAIDKIIIHGRYNNVSLKNDIALIRLKEKIQFDDYKRPICLPTSCNLVNRDFTNTNLLLAGWGISDQNGELIRDGPLRKVTVVASSLEACSQRWSYQVPRSMICTWGYKPGGGVRGMHSGDSGSSLLYRDTTTKGPARYFSIGITSHTRRVPKGEDSLEIYKRYPQGYTRVAAYMSWILNNIEP